jgi:2-polyprenyl-3-methyl-5-hydroxy-6-metoxy-1,4-benzoquinol methylase
MSNKLNIVSSDNNRPEPKRLDSKNGWRREAQAHFERLWLLNPEQFDPMRNCMERERLERTWDLIKKFIDPKDKLITDLACGNGQFSKKLKDAGATVHALDISENALKLARQNVPHLDDVYQECLPHTTLEDDAYDLVIANEVIAYLPAQQLRLFMAELCRLVKPKGFVVCSTPLDFNTQDPWERFASLSETEFKIHEWSCGYFKLYIRLRNFFLAPGLFAKAYKDVDFKQQQLAERKGFNFKWFIFNSQGILGFTWSIIQYITEPIGKFLNQNRPTMLFLEKICKMFWGESGMSHAIFLAERRPLTPLHLPKEEIPIERKGKREVWE